ncbi:N-acetylneuraminate 9-O-acetyltransferase [Tribolium castaneum]|uniref:CAS1 domain-containing protein 1-like Protein n=1 Tax=Tribolium castaneum TaxID=7070 RepID=D6WF47_TRICA|nr:PREDICTED: CAS1 domain-containing protein 1 [Tribolium castaneum]EEZ99845.2 CAS1 domain-containing protein 1-like Protein [Tribolium castaneum]|eukprot:XP_001807591.1 PREDICTED: CAS1 domain-containing protein 1 [Tribolium castaneum]
MTSDKSRIEKIIDQINASNAKKVALLLVIGFVCYHGILHVRYGTNSCKWLLSDGRYKGDQEWQPYGCMLHRYTKIDTRKCLRYIAFYGTSSHFVFIGDKRMQDLYVTFVNHLIQDEERFLRPPEDIAKNLTHTDNTLKVKAEFFGMPFISKAMIDKFRQWQLSKEPPSVIVAGCALQAIQISNASLTMVEEYKVNLTRLVQPIHNLHKKKTKVLWALQEPVNSEKLKPELRIITNEIINLYNKAAMEMLHYSEAEIWRSIRLVGEGMISMSPDGIYLPQRSLLYDIQILLNMYCNDYMNFNDGTCCSSTETYTTLQIVTFAILGICASIAIVMLCTRLIMKWRGRPIHEYSQLPDNAHQPPATPGSYYNLFTSLAKMALIMSYFFLCDRTNFFMKENKYYSEFSFWLPIGYVTVLGLFFTEDSKYTKVLHRDQLNEWKGWMQLVILVYHITGASRILPINMHIKVLISAYLFLLGYEQFCCVWQRGDIGIVSFFRVLFQLNFITVTLCLCMNRPYQFYYFVPLLSFWYLMTYCFLAFPPHITAQTSENNVMQYFYLLIKFVVFFTVITILFMSEVFFEKVFVTRPWKALFVTTDDDIREWWFRWKLDRYTIIYGMGFAVILLLAQRYNIYDDNNHNNLFSRGLALTGILVAIAGIGCYLSITFLCSTELECSEIHSYIVFIPIVGYIVLRNISGVLRTRYSSLFAWFGEISLELFISQYHIWLAADTHGVLVLIPGYPVLNVMITSFIFVCASHEVHRLTKVLLPYAVPYDWKCVLRNFILFLAVLVPIGINDGMF